MQSRRFRIVVTVVAGALLLVPGLVMAFAWGGTLNLEVAVAATVISIAVAVWLPRLKWISAAAAALLIAIPPFPYWASWDERRGQHLHFFRGYSLQNLPLSTFAVFFLMAMLLFAVIFWAVGKRQSSK